MVGAESSAVHAHPLHAALNRHRETLASISARAANEDKATTSREAAITTAALQLLIKQRPQLDGAQYLLAQAELLKQDHDELAVLSALEASVKENPFCSSCLYLLAQRLFGGIAGRTKQDAQQMQRDGFKRLQQSWAADPTYWRAPWKLCSQLVGSGGLPSLQRKSAGARKLAATACFRAAELIDTTAALPGSRDSEAMQLKEKGQTLQMRGLATQLMVELSEQKWCDRALEYV